ncbi:hypothetical protein C8R44DRAFT_776214 [Mycena epipterygia]|nr:hypothetical protein C8R44DRAFT_776214 [Mycena epipterygia]
MTSRTGSILTIAGISLCGIIAYAVYFDYKRRTDSEFRKKIRKEKKRVDKSLAQSREALAAESEVSEADLRDALKQIKSEARPPTQEAKEHYFMSQVAIGEQLAARGDHLPAALSFYRALDVYPSPPELLAIYQKTVPEPIVKIIMGLLNLDLETKIGAYYEVFPPKWTNVAIQSRPKTSDTSGPQKVLVLKKDVAAGEVIYKEHPMLTCLDYDLQLAGSHCTHCLREIQPSLGSLPLTSSASTKSAFCSKPCQVASKTQWHSFLFTLDPPLPAVLELSQITPTAAELEARRSAQAQLVAYLNKDKRVGTMLLAKFIARQLTASNTKTTGKRPPDYAEADSGEYRIEDHVERWSTGSASPPPEEYPLLLTLLHTTLRGLEAFLNEDSHKKLLGKMVFNAFGVCFGGGRHNRPASTLRPEDTELTRTPYGTARQIGTALYSVSPYLSHSCMPNARPSFSSGTSELHLIANKDLKKGEELSIAYVDVTQHAGESTAECRARRRKELARGWKFACECSRCLKEASQK